MTEQTCSVDLLKSLKLDNVWTEYHRGQLFWIRSKDLPFWPCIVVYQLNKGANLPSCIRFDSTLLVIGCSWVMRRCIWKMWNSRAAVSQSYVVGLFRHSINCTGLVHCCAWISHFLNISFYCSWVLCIYDISWYIF